MKSTDRRHRLLPGQAPDRPLHILEVIGNAIIGGMERYVYTLSQHMLAQQLAERPASPDPAIDRAVPGGAASPPRVPASLPAAPYVKITCLAPYESEFTASLRELGMEVFIVAMGDDPTWRAIQFTTELVRSLKIDLLHAHMPRAHMLAGLAGRLASVPVVATIHGMEINLHELSVHRTTGTHLTVVCQQALVNALAVGAYEDRITLIPNGVDLQQFSPVIGSGSGSVPPFRQFLASEHAVPLEAPLVGYVGRISWEKGPDQFVRMAAHIHTQRPEIHFVMVGDGPMRPEIERMIYNHRLEGILHLPGLWHRPWEIYPALDILTQTSRVEGMPFTLLEAMATGLPVAAMGVGGVPEILDVSLSGLLAAPGDYNGLGDAVLHILNHPDLAAQMGRHARRRVEDGYSLANTVRRMSGLFQRLVAQCAKDTPAGWSPLDPAGAAAGGVASLGEAPASSLPVQEPLDRAATIPPLPDVSPGSAPEDRLPGRPGAHKNH